MAKKFFVLWHMPELIGQVDISFSNRLKSSLGRTRVDTKRVWLNPELNTVDVSILEEVLCHELAHIAVFEKYGRSQKPHGQAWSELMKNAGYQPRVHSYVHSFQMARNKTLIQQYEHLCPVCQAVRYARYPMYRWRCSECIDAGLDGKLLVQKLP